MLAQLYIKNIAVISEASIQLSQGFNVFTGETGSGKSILIGAINAVLGGRMAKESIRTGENQAVVRAVFTDIAPNLRAYIQGMGYSFEKDNSLVITRELFADSPKSTCKIGAKNATVSALREIASLLITIHGQNDSQQLLSSEKHIDYIDNFGQLGDSLGQYRAAYQRYVAVHKQLESLNMDEHLKNQRIDMLEFQIKEISAAELVDGEEEEYQTQRGMIKNAEKLTEAANLCQEALLGGEDSQGIVSLLGSLREGLEVIAKLTDTHHDTAAKVNELKYDLEDIADTLRDELNSYDFDPRQIDAIESRLDQIYRLKQKYGTSVAKILAFLENCQTELENLNFSEEQREELEEQLQEAKDEAFGLARELSALRTQAAQRFTALVQEELHFLDMPQVQLSLLQRDRELCSTGCDDIELLIAPNLGEMPRPLAKIASGGEVARIMLAIKNVLADRDNIGTLIFDEIDTGVSGKAAGKIGQKLGQVARSRQVLCVTHLAQVAAFAQRHLCIDKQIIQSRTHTIISHLNHAQRIEELARIGSGENITQTTLQNAEEMLDFAQKSLNS